MAAVVIDTLKLARRLEAAGFAREQAIGAAEAISEVIGEAVVTRDFLDHRLSETEARLDRRFGDVDRRFTEADGRLATMEANLRAHIADTRTELLKWVVGLMLGQTAIIAALVKPM